MVDAMSMLAQVTPKEMIPIIVVGGSMAVAMVGTIMWAIVATVRTKEQERTRREVSAYVAEGSMSPEEGERLLRAGPKRSCGL